jgi:hypothetical protein
MHRLLYIPLVFCGFILTSCSSSSSQKKSYSYDASSSARLSGLKAIPSKSAPDSVRTIIEAGNRIVGKPYRRGGGHGRLEDSAYDCSGTVSYVLCKTGLLDEPTTSDALRDYGKSGEGKHVTIYAKDGHAFIVVDGLRLDTTSNGDDRRGPRWTTKTRSLKGFRARHPEGL